MVLMLESLEEERLKRPKDSEMLLYEAEKVKPQLNLGFQDVGDERAMRHLPMRASYRDWKQPKRQLYAAGSKTFDT